ncbi:MAG: MFS transporter [Steroidobacteraceae bacterium]
MVGVLAGAPLLGQIGDRYGRKVAILLSSVIYGVTTLALIWAHGYSVTIVLRFCTGIGIGGLMPNTIALNSELSPKRLRATLVGVDVHGNHFGQQRARIAVGLDWRPTLAGPCCSSSAARCRCWWPCACISGCRSR